MLNLIIFPISIKVLGQENYGIWLVISALNAWVSIFDLGTQNTLRNKLITCVNENSKMNLRGLLITNSFIFSFTLFIIISFFSALLFLFFDFSSALNLKAVNHFNINTLITICLVVFAFKLFSNNINSILLALQKTYLTLLIITSSNFVAVLIIWFFYLRGVSVGIMSYGLIFLISDVIISVAFPLIYLKFINFDLSFSTKRISFQFFKRHLLSSNVRFFIISILIVATFFSNSFFVGTLLSYDKVVEYNLVNKYFNTLTTLSVVVLNPVWTQVAIYINKQEISKIAGLINKLYRYFIMFIILAALLILASNFFYEKFGGGEIKISYIITITAAIATLQLLFNNIHSYVLNGMNKTTVQIICLSIGAIIMLPAYFLLLKFLHVGLVGAFIVQIIIFLPTTIALPFYMYKYLKQI